MIWWARFHRQAGTELLWSGASRIVLVSALLTLAGTVWVAVRRARQVGGQSDLHGSARWATLQDLKSAGLLQSAGVYVGAWDAGRRRLYLRHDGPQPVLAFAPNRSGKGVGLVVPTLLVWPGSMVVNDPKAGENWRLTAGWRKRAGNLCLRFDPTCTDGSAARYNPLLEIRPWPRDVRDAQIIAEAIIERYEHNTQWEHWNNTAEDFLVGAILHVLYAERSKSLPGCFELLTDPHRSLDDTLAVMRTTWHDPGRQFGWVDAQTGQPTRTHPVVARAVRAVENKSPNERSSVVSSAIAYFKLYRDSIVARNIETCDFAISDLLDAEQPVSLYLTTPNSDIDRTRALTRILLTQIVRRLTETMPDPTRGWERSNSQRLLLMLDEFPLLGELRFFHTELSVLASYGVKVYLIAQDLSQITRAYGKDESITANCDVQIAYAANKLETAEWIAKRTGQRTVHKEIRTYTGSRFALWLPHVIASESESQRPLLTADEVMRLPHGSDEDPRAPGDALIFVSGLPAIHGTKIRYYHDAEFRRRAAWPAPVESDRIAHDWSTWLTHTAVLGTLDRKKTDPAPPQGSADGAPEPATHNLL